MQFIFRHKFLSAFIATVLYCVFILPLTEAIFFDTAVTERRAVVLSYALKAAFGIALFFLSHFVLRFIEKLVRKDAFYWDWLRNTAIYLTVLAAVFLLIYPGYWVYDEFHLLTSFEVYTLNSWQHLFTQVYHTFCLYIIPSGVGIVIVQIVAVSVIAGYVIAKLRTVLKKKWLAYFLFAALLLPPILLNDFYPLRLTFYAFLELLLFTKVLFLYLGPADKRGKYAQFLALSLLIAILATWRSEGIFLLILLPLIVFKLGIFDKKSLLKQLPAVGYTLIALGFVAVSLHLTRSTADPKYQLTATINPLSIMLQQDLQGNVEENLKKIDTVLNLDVIRKYPSYIETPAIWNSDEKQAIREDYQEHLREYYLGFAGLVKDNPVQFIDARIKTYASTNSMDPSTFTPVPGWLTEGYYYQERPAFITTFYEQNKLSRPLNPDVRDATIKTLIASNADWTVSPIRTALWNVTPILVALLAILVHTLIKKRFIWAFLVVLLFAHTMIVFLTAPANYFMYYVPIYLCGSMLTVMYIVYGIDQRRRKKHVRK
jgi:hypothetical protein